jgi:hypothetical protein
MNRYFLNILILLPSLAFAAESVFEGTYNCKGFDPYLNRNYTGTVIVKQQHAVYSLDMHYDTGENYRGTGGQYDPTLMSVVFQDKKDLKRVGLEQYALSNDKNTMQGYWVYLGEDKLGTEICNRVTDSQS